jgi:hypothetical protein
MSTLKLNYKKGDGNSYVAYYNDKPVGLTFIIPEKYNIEDYGISFYGEEDDPIYNFNAAFELIMGEPSSTYIDIDGKNSVTFKDGFVVQIGKTLHLGENEGITISGENGLKKVYFDYFALNENSNSFIEFCKAPREENSVNNELHFIQNKNTKVKLKDSSLKAQLAMLKTEEPFILDLSSSSEIKATNMKLKPFKGNNKLEVKAKKVELNGATIKLKGDAKGDPAIIEQENQDGSIEIKRGTNITLVNSTHVSAKADILEINNNSGVSTEFSGKIHFYAKDNITISGGDYLNAKIESGANRLSLCQENIIGNSSIQIEPKDDSDMVIIKKLVLQNSELKNVVGNFSGSFANCLADGIDARDGGSIYLFVYTDKIKKEPFINIKNLTFKEGSSLTISTKKYSDKSFINCLVDGDSLLSTDSPCEITNSVFKNSDLSIDNKNKVTISNSYLGGKIIAKNINNIDCSNLVSVEVASEESDTSLKDESLSSLKISDYKSFCNRRECDQREHGHNIAQDELQIL